MFTDKRGASASRDGLCEVVQLEETDNLPNHAARRSSIGHCAPSLNVSVYMTARRQINAVELQMGGSPINAESPQQQDIVSRRLKGQKAAIDVAITIAAFLLCFLPGWLMGICRQFVPAEVVLTTNCIFILNSLQPDHLFNPQKRVPCHD